MTDKDGDRSTLKGAITKISYQDPQSGYTVARLKVDGSQEATVVGEIFPVDEGEEIRVYGFWSTHPRYGLQFRSERWEKLEPATVEGIERYLGSGLIKGIGPTYARRLVSTFGLETLTVLSKEPQRLREVEGIGEIRAQRILRVWEEQKSTREVMVFLQGYGVSSSLALKIYRAFGSETVARVKENPYCLAKRVHGVGFVLADRIANSMGIKGDFPLRVQAGLLHILGKFSEQGHCFVPLGLLKSNASSLLGIEGEASLSAIEKLASEGELIVERADREEDTRVYLRELHEAEFSVASALRNLLSASSGLKDKGFKRSTKEDHEELPELSDPITFQPLNPSTIVLEQEQREALIQALRQKVLVITGGPGTGKTTLLTSLLALLRNFNANVALAAPTGRAAKRMGEMAGEEAKTIHRLLEYNPRDGGFQRGEDHSLDADFVIIDEASMVDLPLMGHLLRSINPAAHLILLGDVDQLPSVGPGCVLRDLIDSGVVPVVVLRHVFRQGSESLIVVNAHRILQGQSLLFGEGREKRDFVFISRDSDQEILATIKELVKERIPRSFHKDSAEEVQVLSPMHRGLLGTIQLNQELQALLNPEGLSIEHGGRLFRTGDKVMQQRNNYDKGVFNGDLGKIIKIDKENDELEVEFYGRSVGYGFDELSEIGLAYATSVHKSQGSEYPVVVIPLHTSHYLMLHRSILYTAVTRGKELVVLVGSKKALSMAIRNVRIEQRFTGLKEKLKEPARMTEKAIGQLMSR